MIGRQRVAVAGATGLVGEELVGLLAARGVRAPRIVGRATPPDELADAFGVDVTFLCTPADVSRRLAPIAMDAGSVVIDCSSAFRHDPEVPLVVPEVNGIRARDHRGLLASPNCSTILLLLAVAPVHRGIGCRRVAVTTYQAVSGAGRAGLRELESSARAALGGKRHAPAVFPVSVAFNVFVHESAVDAASGYNEEERKVERESLRILEEDDGRVGVTATCARVPVFRSHSLAVTLTLERPAREAEIRSVLADAPGVSLLDDRAAGRFPDALSAAHGDGVLVGRIRPDPSQGGGPDAWRGFHLWIAGDQLRKGAALNALQIADIVTPRPAAPGRPARGRGSRRAR